MAGTKLVILAAVAPIFVSGVVEYSFDEGRRIIRAEKFIYQVKTDALQKKQKELLDQPGAQVSVRLPPGAIARVWPARNDASAPVACPDPPAKTTKK